MPGRFSSSGGGALQASATCEALRRPPCATQAIRPPQAVRIALPTELIPRQDALAEPPQLPSGQQCVASVFKPPLGGPQHTRAQARQEPEAAEGHAFPRGQQPGFGLRQLQPRPAQLLDDPGRFLPPDTEAERVRKSPFVYIDWAGVGPAGPGREVPVKPTPAAAPSRPAWSAR